VPNDAHAPLALQAIDHQLAVVVDKPLAVTAAEAEAVVQAVIREQPDQREVIRVRPGRIA
jgi:predicted dehydrogenase